MASTDNPFAAYDTYDGPGASQAVATALMGPCFAGWLAHLILYGIVLTLGTQYIYSQNYKTDRKWTKGTNQLRNTDTLLLGTSYLDSFPFGLIGTVAAVTQAGLAKRASKFFVNRRTHRTIFLSITGTMIVGSWLASMGVTILNGLYASGDPGATEFTIHSFNDFLASWSFVSAAVDIIITASLCLVLSGELRGFNRVTDDILKTIILLAMKTGALTSLVALSGAILGVAFPSTDMQTANIFIAFVFPLSSLYTLSYLVTLATRGAHLRTTTPFTMTSGFESNGDFGRVTKAVRVVVHSQEIMFSPVPGGKKSPELGAGAF
ncbi:hypothetical protein RQP46_010407 [Phenoliferia psychrophenolica]